MKMNWWNLFSRPTFRGKSNVLAGSGSTRGNVTTMHVATTSTAGRKGRPLVRETVVPKQGERTNWNKEAARLIQEVKSHQRKLLLGTNPVNRIQGMGSDGQIRTVEPRKPSQTEVEKTNKEFARLAGEISTLLTQARQVDVKNPQQSHNGSPLIIRELLRQLVICELPHLTSRLPAGEFEAMISELFEFHERLVELGKPVEFATAINRLVAHTRARDEQLESLRERIAKAPGRKISKQEFDQQKRLLEEKLREKMISDPTTPTLQTIRQELDQFVERWENSRESLTERLEQKTHLMIKDLLGLLHSAKTGGELFRTFVARDICPKGGIGDWLPLLARLREISIQRDGRDGWSGECLSSCTNVALDEERKQEIRKLTAHKFGIEALGKDLIDLACKTDTSKNSDKDQVDDNDKSKKKAKALESFFGQGTNNVSLLLDHKQIDDLLGTSLKGCDLTLALYLHEMRSALQIERKWLKQECEKIRKESTEGILDWLQDYSDRIRDDKIRNLITKPLSSMNSIEREQLNVFMEKMERNAAVLYEYNKKFGGGSGETLVVNDDAPNRESLKVTLDQLRELGISTLDNADVFLDSVKEYRNWSRVWEKSQKLEEQIRLCERSMDVCFDEDARKLLFEISGQSADKVSVWDEKSWEVVRHLVRLNCVSVAMFKRHHDHVVKMAGEFDSSIRKGDPKMESKFKASIRNFGRKYFPHFYTLDNAVIDQSRKKRDQKAKNQIEKKKNRMLRLGWWGAQTQSKFLRKALKGKDLNKLSPQEIEKEQQLKALPVEIVPLAKDLPGSDKFTLPQIARMIHILKDREKLHQYLYDQVTGKEKYGALLKSYLDEYGLDFDLDQIIEHISKKDVRAIEGRANKLAMLSAEQREILEGISGFLERNAWREPSMWQSVIMQMTEEFCPKELDLSEFSMLAAKRRQAKADSSNLSIEEEKKYAGTVLKLLDFRAKIREQMLLHGCTEELLEEIDFDQSFDNITSMWATDEAERSRQLEYAWGLVSQLDEGRENDKVKEPSSASKLVSVLATEATRTRAVTKKEHIEQVLLSLHQDDFIFLNHTWGVAGSGYLSPLIPLFAVSEKNEAIIRSNEISIDRVGDGIRLRTYFGRGWKSKGGPGIGLPEVGGITADVTKGTGYRKWTGTEIFFNENTFAGGYPELCRELSQFLFDLRHHRIDMQFILRHAKSMGEFVQDQHEGNLGLELFGGLKNDTRFWLATLKAKLGITGGFGMSTFSKKRVTYEKDVRMDHLDSNRRAWEVALEASASVSSPVPALSLGVGHSRVGELVSLKYSIPGKIYDPHALRKVKAGWGLRLGFHQKCNGKTDKEKVKILKGELKELLNYMPNEQKRLEAGFYDKAIEQLNKGIDGRDEDGRTFLAMEAALKQDCLLKADRLSTELELLRIDGVDSEEKKKKIKKLTKEIDNIVDDFDNYYVASIFVNALHEGYGKNTIEGGETGVGVKYLGGFGIGAQPYTSNWHEWQFAISRVDLKENYYDFDNGEEEVQDLEIMPISDQQEITRMQIKNRYNVGWSRLNGDSFQKLNKTVNNLSYNQEYYSENQEQFVYS